MTIIANKLFHHAAKVPIEKSLPVLFKPPTHADLAAAKAVQHTAARQGPNLFCPQQQASQWAKLVHNRLGARLGAHLLAAHHGKNRQQKQFGAGNSHGTLRQTAHQAVKPGCFCTVTSCFAVSAPVAVEIFTPGYRQPLSIGPTWPIACNG